MATVRDQILARAAAALAGATPAGANVFRSREVSITRGVTPAIVVMFESETLERMGDAADKHLMRMQVLMFLRGDPWDALADPVDQAAHQVLMSDAQLRGLVLDIRRVSLDAEAEEADRTAGTLTAVYLVSYLTKAADLSAQP